MLWHYQDYFCYFQRTSGWSLNFHFKYFVSLSFISFSPQMFFGKGIATSIIILSCNFAAASFLKTKMMSNLFQSFAFPPLITGLSFKYIHTHTKLLSYGFQWEYFSFNKLINCSSFPLLQVFNPLSSKGSQRSISNLESKTCRHWENNTGRNNYLW